MARPASQAVHEDQIREALEPLCERFDQDLEQLYERFGQDAVEAVMQTGPRRRGRGRVKSGRGAPTIDRELRDGLVFALVVVVKLGIDEDNTSRACHWIANNITIRGKEMRGGSVWQRSWGEPEALRRIYNKAQTRWRDDWVFQQNVLFTYKMFIDWRRRYPDFRWGFGLKGIPTHFDVLFSKPPTLLIDGIDKLQKLMEQAQSKK